MKGRGKVNTVGGKFQAVRAGLMSYDFKKIALIVFIFSLIVYLIWRAGKKKGEGDQEDIPIPDDLDQTEPNDAFVQSVTNQLIEDYDKRFPATELFYSGDALLKFNNASMTDTVAIVNKYNDQAEHKKNLKAAFKASRSVLNWIPGSKRLKAYLDTAINKLEKNNL